MPEVSILFPDRPGDIRSIIGVSETLTRVVEPEIHRILDGIPIIAEGFGTKWAVSLSASGDRVQSPPLDDVRIGDLLTVDCCSWWRSIVQMPDPWDGDIDRIDIRRSRPAAKSWFISRDGRFAVDALTTAHPNFFLQMLSLGDRAGVSLTEGVYWYRPQLSCVVTSISLDGTSSERSQGWSLELEEEYPS